MLVCTKCGHELATAERSGARVASSPPSAPSLARELTTGSSASRSDMRDKSTQTRRALHSTFVSLPAVIAALH